MVADVEGGACVVAWGCVVAGGGEACMVAGGGTCMVAGRGHAWFLGGHVWRKGGGACMGYDDIRRYDQ